MASHLTRQRYWARSLEGFRTLALAKPNAGHVALAYSERTGGPVRHIISQNVDNLHEMAGSTSVLHLHGTINDLRCMDCNTISSRDAWQQRLRDLNPAFVKHHDQPSHLVHARPATVHHPHAARDGHTHLISPALGASPVSLPSASSSLVASMRPDGDVDLPQTLDFSDFVLPSCPVCTDGNGNPLQPRVGDVDPNTGVGADGAVGVGIEPMQRGILKPDLVFFGANVPKHVHARADELLAAADGILVCGTSLTVWSAFRLIRTTLDRVLPGQQLSVVQLAEQLARGSRQSAQEQRANEGGDHGSNRIQHGAAILSPVTPFQVQLDCTGSSSSPRVPSVIPIVVLNQGPTRADPLVAAATNVIKIDHTRASHALNFILDVPEEVQLQAAAQQLQSAEEIDVQSREGRLLREEYERIAQRNIDQSNARKENIE